MSSDITYMVYKEVKERKYARGKVLSTVGKLRRHLGTVY